MNNAITSFAYISSQVKRCAKTLGDVGLSGYSEEVEKILKGAEGESFSVVVVGEFNRGKSSLVNRLLGRKVLPVGDLPTTAIMTEIRSGGDEMVRLFDALGKEVSSKQLSETALNELRIHHFEGDNFTGRATINLSNQWLEKANITLYDTPGAGDLEEGRAQMIGDMLWRCDGVIVAISATSALSLTEKLFVEERIKARKFACVLVVVTKLDLVDESERADVLRFVKKRLADWKLEVPVCVPDDTLLPESLRGEFGGLESVRGVIEGWSGDPKRYERRASRVKSNVCAIMESAHAALVSQMTLLEEDSKEKRDVMIAQKKLRLQEAKIVWESLHTEMQKRCTACYSQLVEKIDECTKSICGRLQFEAGHAGDPKGWWRDDYPYRLKIELSNLAVSVENVASRQIAADVQWYNCELSRIFKTAVPFCPKKITEKMVEGLGVPDNPVFEDLERKRTWCRVGSALLMISGAAFCTATGCWPLIATVGLGTGTGIMTEKLIKAKVKEQRKLMRQLIENHIPLIVRKASEKAESRLNKVYEGIVSEGEHLERQWLSGQRKAIDETVNVAGCMSIDSVRDKIAKIDEVMAMF